MGKCIVIGGGLAGISSAIHLQKAGNQVELIEASPKLGGRAYSFIDKKTNTEVDNGQHILMGVYKSTFELLEIIGSSNLPEYQKNLSVNFKNREKNKYFLKAPNFIYPLNLLYALLTYRAITVKEKYYLLKLFGKILVGNSQKLKHKNVKTWLEENKQSENAIKALWEMIGIGALNTKLNEASAELFFEVLSRMFFGGNKSSTIVLPKLSLNKLFIDPTKEFFKKNDIKYSLSEKLVSIEITNNMVSKLVTDKSEITEFKNVILALPQFALNTVTCNEEILTSEIVNMDTTSILTAHIWYNGNFLEEKFVGLINSQIHWIFKNKDHYSIVISASDYLNDLKSSEIIEMILAELSIYYSNFNRKNVTNHIIIKEKRATLKSSVKNEEIRKKIKSNYENMVFAGDWTNTNLPGTIEGAILSGKYAAKSIEMLKN